MGSWMLPVTATAFAAGLLLWPELPIHVEPALLLGVGLSGLVARGS